MKEENNTSPFLLHAPPPQTSSSASSRNYWSDEETAALIEAYRVKWYYLKLGKVSATQWQQVADEVLARCNTHKTSLQCSRKMYYLKKRYHDEIKRARNPKPQRYPYAWVVRWVHFHRMDSMENGYGLLDLHADPIKKEEDDDYEQEEKEKGEDGENQGFYNGIRVMDRVLDPGHGFASGQGLGGGYVEGGCGFGKSEDGDGSIDDLVEEMVAPIETSGDEFVQISKMKMAEAREVVANGEFELEDKYETPKC